MDRSELAQRIEQLAHIAGIGTVGLATGGDCVELFVRVPFREAAQFGEEVASLAGCAVRLYHPQRLHYSHPAHFSVRWIGADVPRVAVPPGCVRSLRGREVEIEFSTVPHFVVSTRRERQPSGAASLLIPAPPLGAFLI